MEQKLLTIFEKYGLGDGEITDAGLNKRENLLTVTVRCGHITSAENIACLERELCALMPGCRTKVIIRCGGLSALLSGLRRGYAEHTQKDMVRHTAGMPPRDTQLRLGL